MRILMTGATGLVGQGVLLETLAHPDVSRVAVLGRRGIRQDDPRVENLLVDRFDELGAVVDRLAPFDACFYCAGAPPLGTPEDRYRHVTRDLTLHVARAYAQRNPGSRVIYISGAHADPSIESRRTLAKKLNKLTDYFRFSKHLGNAKHQVGSRCSLRQRTGKMYADDIRRQKIYRLPQHTRLSFDPTNTPTDDPEPVDHRRVGVSAD